MQAVTLTSAENALKSFYLDVVAHQLNTETNPLYNKIKQSENNVFGKEVRAAACYGVNGGIAAGTETANPQRRRWSLRKGMRRTPRGCGLRRRTRSRSRAP